MRGRDRHVRGVDRSLAGHGRGVKEPSRQRTRSVRHCKYPDALDRGDATGRSVDVTPSNLLENRLRKLPMKPAPTSVLRKYSRPLSPSRRQAAGA